MIRRCFLKSLLFFPSLSTSAKPVSTVNYKLRFVKHNNGNESWYTIHKGPFFTRFENDFAQLKDISGLCATIEKADLIKSGLEFSEKSLKILLHLPHCDPRMEFWMNTMRRTHINTDDYEKIKKFCQKKNEVLTIVSGQTEWFNFCSLKRLKPLQPSLLSRQT